MVADNVFTCKQCISASHRNELEDQRARTYHNNFLRGKLWMAVWWIAERYKGGVFHLGDAWTKTVDIVLGMLRDKHPET